VEETEIIGAVKKLWQIAQSESFLNLIAVLAGLVAVGRAVREYYRMKSENRRLNEKGIELERLLTAAQAEARLTHATFEAKIQYQDRSIALFQEVGAEVVDLSPTRAGVDRGKLLEFVKNGARRTLDFEQRLHQAKQRGVWFLPSERFIPPKESKPKFIAMANLKGGVGKSTISANLALELGRRGKRVLLVDLDWQQSLTRLCLTKGQTTAQFAGDSGPVSDELLRYCGISTDGLRTFRPIRVDRDDAEIYLLPAPYRLSLAEDLSLLSWFADTSKEDARFLVADRLQRWTANFQPNPQSDAVAPLDYVIMDCPPRLTVSLTSALSCADVVLIPSLADDTSLNGVGLFFSQPLRELRDVIWPSPEDELFATCPVFGLCANRIARTNLIPETVTKFRDFAEGLALSHRDLPIFASTTAISQAKSFGEAAQSTQNNRRVFALDSAREATREQLRALANDVEGWCTQAVAVPNPRSRRTSLSGRNPIPVDANL